MYKPHAGYRAPNDPDTPVWRYVDFTRFMAMLHSSTLWFARVDKLQDNYEGIFPQGYHAAIMSSALSLMKDVIPLGQLESELVDLRTKLEADYAKRSRRSYYVNCWHLNEHESGAMWKVYGDNALAIRSTFARFRDGFAAEPDWDVWIGAMRYVDFTDPAAFLDPNANIAITLHKRPMYESEKELRAVIHRPSEKADPTPSGLEVRVELGTLIESVYVGPGRPDWFAKLVKQMLERFGLSDTPVQRSGMDGMPLYLD